MSLTEMFNTAKCNQDHTDHFWFTCHKCENGLTVQAVETTTGESGIRVTRIKLKCSACDYYCQQKIYWRP